jgi:hypothetical protein
MPVVYYVNVMNTVGNNLPPIYWADHIHVEARDGGFEVSGIRRRRPQPGALEKGNIVVDYAMAIAQGARFEKGADNAPHLKFVRADSDEKLLEFTQTYGPFAPVAASVRLGLVEPGCDQEVAAFEELVRLRRERNTYVAATELLAQIRNKVPALTRIGELVDEIWSGIFEWYFESQDEESRRDELALDVAGPSWVWNNGSLAQMTHAVSNFSQKMRRKRLRNPELDGHNYLIAEPTLGDRDLEQIIESSHAVLCAILNGFPSHVRRWRGHSIELPPADLAFGIRPALYYLLRCDYLSDRHIARCPQAHCEEPWFLQSRLGRIFCSEKCERKHRQRKYYLTRGKETKRAYYQKEVRQKRARRSKAHLRTSQEER